MSRLKPTIGVCPWCGKRVLLKKNGRLHKHGFFILIGRRGRPSGIPCMGTDDPPAPLETAKPWIARHGP